MTDFAEEIRRRMNRDRGGNTIWLEAVFEQGRQVQRSDIDEVSEFTEEQVEVWAESTAARPDINSRDVFCVRGTERPDDDEFFGVSPENRLHCFIRVPADQMPTVMAEGLKTSIAQRFQGDNPLQDRPPQAAIGRGFSTMAIVDPAVVAAAVPQLTGPPREDVEVF